MKARFLVILTAVLAVFVLSTIYLNKNASDQDNAVVVPELTQVSNEVPKREVDPANVDPSLFITSTTIDNKYFKLPMGRKLVYEGETEEDGLERVEITIPGDTKEILGVKTLVYLDKVWQDDELVEETRDYLAQDVYGNVWYFGEDVNNYGNGKLLDHEGAWLAGVDGAQPGIWIKASHIVGDSYRQEFYKGKAEDMRDVSSIGEPVQIALGSYKDCVKMYDWTPLEPESKEFKHYCSEVGAMVLETKPDTGEKLELKSVN
ncbi:hypothetical protein A2337_02780 [candidate division WWE3 bacterium RIFOXYB2_FULL_43_9]|nr:MAG: hypothetical protein A2337_02780 [candidate division WWE3 bacterium RIFOXYB2_FULL_43_9]